MHKNQTSNQAISKEISTILDTSINEYSNILNLMQNLARKRNSDQTSEISAVSITLFKKQQTAAESDQNLMQILSNYPDALKNHRIKERARIIKEIISLNKIITPKFEAIKSLLFDELQQLKKGRSAIQGYHQVRQKQGRNINNAL